MPLGNLLLTASALKNLPFRLASKHTAVFIADVRTTENSSSECHRPKQCNREHHTPRPRSKLAPEPQARRHMNSGKQSQEALSSIPSSAASRPSLQRRCRPPRSPYRRRQPRSKTP